MVFGRVYNFDYSRDSGERIRNKLSIYSSYFMNDNEYLKILSFVV